MKVTEDAANRVLRSKVLCVINLVGLFPPDGLHAGDPGYMEDRIKAGLAQIIGAF